MKFLIVLCSFCVVHTFAIGGVNLFSATGHTNSEGVVFIDNGYQINSPPFCHGVLIHSRMIMSLAVCCRPKKTAGFYDIIVQLGSTRMQDEGHFYYVQDYHFLGDDGDDDLFRLALIRTRMRINFTPYALPMALPRATDELGEPESYAVYSSGAIDATRPYYLHHELMRETWPIQDPAVCEKQLGKPKTKEALYCLGDNSGTFLTPHDMGAPLIKSRMVYGLGCYSGKPDEPKYVAWFVNIGSAADRIYAALKQFH